MYKFFSHKGDILPWEVVRLEAGDEILYSIARFKDEKDARDFLKRKIQDGGIRCTTPCD